MVNLGGIGSTATGALMTWGFWLLILVVVLGVSVGSLAMRKKAKYLFPTVIFTDNGNGKVGIRFTRAGWFKSKKVLGGLFDVGGERRLEVKDGRIVQKGSSADFHEIGFKTALILMEKPDDPKILVPVDRCMLDAKSLKILMAIAPADYRDASSKIISDAEKESMSKWTEIAQMLVFGFIGMVLFISIILVIQYVRNTMADAQALHREALQFYEKSLERLSAVPSGNTAP
jgi:ABC-type Fe3+-siderophore transport system permease subunit